MDEPLDIVLIDEDDARRETLRELRNLRTNAIEKIRFQSIEWYTTQCIHLIHRTGLPDKDKPREILLCAKYVPLPHMAEFFNFLEFTGIVQFLYEQQPSQLLSWLRKGAALFPGEYAEEALTSMGYFRKIAQSYRQGILPHSSLEFERDQLLTLMPPKSHEAIHAHLRAVTAAQPFPAPRN